MLENDKEMLENYKGESVRRDGGGGDGGGGDGGGDVCHNRDTLEMLENVRKCFKMLTAVVVVHDKGAITHTARPARLLDGRFLSPPEETRGRCASDRADAPVPSGPKSPG